MSIYTKYNLKFAYTGSYYSEHFHYFDRLWGILFSLMYFALFSHIFLTTCLYSFFSFLEYFDCLSDKNVSILLHCYWFWFIWVLILLSPLVRLSFSFHISSKWYYQIVSGTNCKFVQLFYINVFSEIKRSQIIFGQMATNTP